MTRAIALIAFAFSCVDQTTPDCGARPSAPGYAVAFDTVNGQDIATLSRVDWLALTAWKGSIETWATCEDGSP